MLSSKMVNVFALHLIKVRIVKSVFPVTNPTLYLTSRINYIPSASLPQLTKLNAMGLESTSINYASVMICMQGFTVKSARI
jgi:hypothetical protein